MSNTTTFRGSTSRTHPKFSRIREFKDIDPWDWVDHRTYTPDALRLGMVTVIDNEDCEIKVSNEDHYHSLQNFDHPFNCTGQISPIVVLRVEINLKQSGTFQVMDVFAYKRIFRHDVIYKAINGSVSYDINTDAGRLCGTYSYLTWSFGDIHDQGEDYLGSRASFFENGFTNGRSITFDRVVLTPRPQSAHRAVRSVPLSTVIPDAPQVYYVIIGESPGWYFINEPINTRTARTIRDFNNEQRHQLAKKRLRLPRESMESAISGLLSG